MNAAAPAHWQGIESAPKPHHSVYEPILAWCPDAEAPNGGDIRVVWWESGEGCWVGDTTCEEHPTHWMPLPPAPDFGDKQ